MSLFVVFFNLCNVHASESHGPQQNVWQTGLCCTALHTGGVKIWENKSANQLIVPHSSVTETADRLGLIDRGGGGGAKGFIKEQL
jgi:hypothetical protein